MIESVSNIDQSASCRMAERSDRDRVFFKHRPISFLQDGKRDLTVIEIESDTDGAHQRFPPTGSNPSRSRTGTILVEIAHTKECEGVKVNAKAWAWTKYTHTSYYQY